MKLQFPHMNVTLESHSNMPDTPLCNAHYVSQKIGLLVQRELKQLSRAFSDAADVGSNLDDVANQFWESVRERNIKENRANIRWAMRFANQHGVPFTVEGPNGLLSQEELNEIEEEGSDDEDGEEDDWITVRRWGRRAAAVAAQSAHSYGALARQESRAVWVEVYMQLGDAQQLPPQRPEYYQGLQPYA